MNHDWEKSMKIRVVPAIAAAFLSLAAVSQAAPPAPANAAPTAGTVVYDPQGAEIGKVESVGSGGIVVDTGTAKATLPQSAFGTSAKGPTLNTTKAQLEALVAASVAKTEATLASALVPGAEVHGKAGAVIGTVKQVEGEQVIVDRTAGGAVSLNKDVFASGTGGLSISLTAQELDAAAKAATES
jgi:hypothetical protein